MQWAYSEPVECGRFIAQSMRPENFVHLPHVVTKIMNKPQEFTTFVPQSPYSLLFFSARFTSRGRARAVPLFSTDFFFHGLFIERFALLRWLVMFTLAAFRDSFGQYRGGVQLSSKVRGKIRLGSDQRGEIVAWLAGYTDG